MKHTFGMCMVVLVWLATAGAQQKALALEHESAERHGHACIYAGFVEKKLHNFKRACELQRANCSASEQHACSNLK